MARQVTFQATPRDQKGKGVARSLRREGKIPAVIYGRGREPEALAVQVVALGDVEAHFDRIARERARREAERLLGLEQVLRRGRWRGGEREAEEECADHGRGAVSAATQSR